MMAVNPATRRKWVNRLYVFNAIKRYMQAHEKPPSVEEVAEAVGMPEGTVDRHVRALVGADGFPVPLVVWYVRPKGQPKAVASHEAQEWEATHGVVRHVQYNE